jgi:hypothetical protein
MEEEFNAWYDDEHLPERLAIPGFRSARRWVARCAPGEGKYLATYELDSPQVLESAAYLAHVGEHFTPWTRRCLGKAVLFRRWACEQAEPGDADPHPDCAALLLAMADEQSAARLLAVPEALRVRRFVAHAGSPAHIALYELSSPDAARALKPVPGCLYRLYRAYPV